MQGVNTYRRRVGHKQTNPLLHSGGVIDVWCPINDDYYNSFEPSNWFTKYVWLFYNYIFYNKLRNKYAETCRDYINNYMNWVKENYNLKTVKTAEDKRDFFREEMDKETPPEEEFE